MTGSVVDQVVHHPAEQVGVGPDTPGIGRLHVDLDVPALRHRPPARRRLVEEIGDVEIRLRRSQRTRVGPGQHEELVDHPAHVLDLGFQPAQNLLILGRRARPRQGAFQLTAHQ
ncbi:MAG: hypothetical protein M3067_01395, partial [Chloroflexota bacterium]|nr:hypothetical protein [Chloroflexota bacterium]